MKIDRLLAIIVMLLNRRKATARELAEHFGVSIRTIYRDVESINNAGIPVVAYQGYEGGFCIMDNYKLNRQLLTFDDMVSILTALKGVNTTFKDREITNAIEKISALIPDDKEQDYLRHSEQFVMDILPWGYGKRQQKCIQDIYVAISSSHLLNFTYCNAQGSVSSRTVEPMTLVFKAPGWYLFAWCCTRADYRVFKLSRMKQVMITLKHFRRRKKTYHEYFAPDYDPRPHIDIVLKFGPAARHKVEDWFHDDTLEFAEDGSCTVTFPVPEDDWIYSMILSYGADVEVLSPTRIRETVRNKAEAIAQKYY
ncbi:MAG: WYL domain-containing protein [Chitinivibrionales bacterium]|nr:WYL domain-containing protein [Chitinivibrionales bacterium]